jgi:hypothetical protein
MSMPMPVPRFMLRRMGSMPAWVVEAKLLQVLMHLFLVKVVGFPLLKPDRVHWAVAEARSQSVAEVFRHEPCLAVNDLDGPLRAGRDALAAAVAQVGVDVHNRSGLLHRRYPPQ